MKLFAAIGILATGCGATLVLGSQAGGGQVTAPEPGALIAGDTASLLVRVAGTYPDSDRTLAVEVLDDPEDLTSWTAIAGAHVDDTGAFGVDVQPGTSRWPAGGVLRLRVVDDTDAALPIDPSEPDTTVVAIANPGTPPGSWVYLEEKPTGSAAETAAYYAATGAPATLDAFRVRYGFAASEIVADYYNANDLGIGRDSHCTVSGGGVACYVRNYGTFGGVADAAMAALAAGGAPLATVALVYRPPIDAPDAVSFVVYDAAGELATQAVLDTVGDNVSIPQSCLNCHGGRATYDATTHAVLGARFLPFDPGALDVSSAAARATQPAALAALDQVVAQTSPTPAIAEILSGLFAPNGTFDPAFVPAAWATSARDRKVYRQVIAPYCRGCHTSFSGTSATFTSPDDVRANTSAIVGGICGAGPHGMPAAEVTANRFYASPARPLLLAWLGAAGACARH